MYRIGLKSRICRHWGMVSLILFIFTSTSCKKLVNVGSPITSINQGNVFTTDDYAIASVTGIYSNIMLNSMSGGGLTSLSCFPSLSADELTIYPGNTSTVYYQYYINSLNSLSMNTEPNFWNSIYSTIYTANVNIFGLTASTSLTPSIKQQLLGESLFIRAFCYFYLVNLYGDVPLALTTDYKVDAVLARAPSEEVWQQIIADLTTAQGLLSANYLDGTLLVTDPQRVRPTTWAATALLARSYLYTGKYDSAELEATTVLSNSTQFSLSSIDTVFLMAATPNNEAIWQLQPVNEGQNTQDALLYVLPSSGPNNTGSFPVYMSNALAGSFEPGDLRRINWVDSVIVGGVTYYYPFKYKVSQYGAPVTEYEMVLRLGEQYLIRAEAEAELGDSSDAVNDLDRIRTRADLPNYSAANQGPLLSVIQHERRVELFTEWANRWFDLRRTGTIDEVMGGSTGACRAKGGSWSSNWEWYPISLYEIQHDPNLVQNMGY
jgi:hypothetical protein